MKKLFGAFVIALMLAASAPVVQAQYHVTWYGGLWYPYWWNIFVWCEWRMWVDQDGNWMYWDTCGGFDSYLSLN